jgi:hypothetical protein
VPSVFLTSPVRFPGTLPVQLAVIVPAAKSPFEFLATIAEAVFSAVASVTIVTAAVSVPEFAIVKCESVEESVAT